MIAVLLAMSFPAYAANLGTATEGDTAVAEPGSNATFTLLFWTTDAEKFPVRLSVAEQPENWKISINPERFDLPSASSGRSIYLPERGYVSETEAIIAVSIPSDAEEGVKSIAIKAVAGGDSAENIAVLQENVFRLAVDVKREAKQYLPETPEATSTTKDDIKNRRAPAESSFAEEQGVYVILGVLIAFISWKIYKKP